VPREKAAQPARPCATRLTKHTRANADNVQLVRYAIEQLLYRLSVSPHCDRFILNGAMLFSL
jgi:hypothetical protein